MKSAFSCQWIFIFSILGTDGFPVFWFCACIIIHFSIFCANAFPTVEFFVASDCPMFDARANYFLICTQLVSNRLLTNSWVWRYVLRKTGKDMPCNSTIVGCSWLASERVLGFSSRCDCGFFGKSFGQIFCQLSGNLHANFPANFFRQIQALHLGRNLVLLWPGLGRGRPASLTLTLQGILN